MTEKNIEITIYDKEGNAVKTATAKTLDLRFGSIRKIMEVLKIEDTTDTAQLLKTILTEWDDIIEILSECFPEIMIEEWDYVKVADLLPVIVKIVKSAFSEMMKIPTDKKNA